jgi:hypothetical protein
VQVDEAILPAEPAAVADEPPRSSGSPAGVSTSFTIVPSQQSRRIPAPVQGLDN